MFTFCIIIVFLAAADRSPCTDISLGSPGLTGIQYYNTIFILAFFLVKINSSPMDFLWFLKRKRKKKLKAQCRNQGKVHWCIILLL